MKILKNETVLRSMLEKVGDLLKRDQFKRSGDTLYRWVDHRRLCWIIHFQRRSDSNAETLKFTINIGVFSRRLHEHNWGKTRNVPCIWDAAVQKRIGFLLPSERDRWWDIGFTTRESLLYPEMAGILMMAALPFLRQIDDE